MKKPAIALALLLSACAGAYPDTTVPLPPAAAAGPRAPEVNAIYGAVNAFSNPASLTGRPAEAALAVIRLEWLAAAVPRNLEFSNFSNLTGPSLAVARREVRQALGIAQNAPPQAVIGGLDRAGAALSRGDNAAAEAALTPPVFSPGTVARLANLPPLPQADFATRRAQHDLEFGRDEELIFSRLR
jgi:hypothetical protein